jgi:low temperature requirement protein LtrA
MDPLAPEAESQLLESLRAGDDQAGAQRVSALELFFDLVFVFTITQLTTVLVREPNARGVAQVVLMLGVIWWMYGGYAWLTNAVPPTDATRRLILLGGMGGYLVLALAVPGAFRGSGLSFGIAYMVVVSVHALLFSRSPSVSVGQALRGLARANLGTATLVLVGGALGGTAQWVLWALAVSLEWITPRLTETEGFEIAPSHFVERHGLVVIIAIGESVVAVGIGASGLPIDLPLVGVALLGLALSGCLWWAYFGGDDERAERALAAAHPRRRPRMAVDAFGYWHLPILFGIVAMAATVRRATAHPSAHLHVEPALGLAGGALLFMLGDVFFRRTLGIGRDRWRAICALVAPLTIPLGLWVAAVAQLGALAALLGGALAWEYATEGSLR